jgi:hypothetical protein
LTGRDRIATASGLLYGPDEKTPESLLTLVEYLELSLDEGQRVVMMRHSTDVCAVYLALDRPVIWIGD